MNTTHDDDVPASNFWFWLTRASLAAAILAILGGIMTNFVPKINDAERVENQLAQHKETELELRQRRDMLRQKKMLLQTNAEYQQQRVRDRLGQKLTGEEIYRFVEPGQAP